MNGIDKIREGKALVAKGGKMISEGNWCIGDGACLAAPMLEHGANRSHDTRDLASSNSETLREISLSEDISLSSLKEYRRVANAWPKTKRHSRTTFSVHQEFASLPDRFEVINDPPLEFSRVLDDGTRIWTVDGARKFMAKAPTRHAPPPKDLAGYIAEALRYTSMTVEAAKAGASSDILWPFLREMQSLVRELDDHVTPPGGAIDVDQEFAGLLGGE